MKFKKLLFYLCIIISVFVVYKIAFTGQVNYLVLGDYLSEGINPYGEVSFGYSDYLFDYLRDEDKLNDYINGFTSSDYEMSDIANDILVNKSILHDDLNINIRSALRESGLVTVSIGMNDFIKILDINNIETRVNNINLLKKEILSLVREYDELLSLIKKYAKGNIVVIGLYNPYQYLTDYKQDIDYLVKNANSLLSDVCKNHDINFVDLYDIFDGGLEYFPNPNSVYPTTQAHRKIFGKIRSCLKY